MNKKNTINKNCSASIDIKKATAGKKIDLVLTLTCGDFGIKRSGGVKVLFRAISDAGVPQFSDPNSDNFVNVDSENEKLEIILENSTTGIHHRLHERPWWKGFIATIKKSSISSKGKISFNFHKWQQQTFSEAKFELKIFIDPFGTGKFTAIHSSPTFKIVADRPKQLLLQAPTLVEHKKNSKIQVVLLDKFGNPCKEADGSVCIFNSDKSIHKKIELNEGRASTSIQLNDIGTTRLKAKWNNISSVSNPIIVRKHLKKKLFWADLHGQSEETVGIKSNTIKDYFEFAKSYGFLDVVSHQGNDFQITDFFWNKMNDLSNSFTKNGKFIVLPGYEWSANTNNGGDHNVFFLHDNESIFRSSTALIEDNTHEIIANIKELTQRLKNTEYLIGAHAGGRKTNLEKSRKVDLVEVHSVWGNSEWLLEKALQQGQIVGIMANSDGHTGRPGLEHPTRTFFTDNGGLTCIIADGLTRNKIFKALKSRHCYATTGERIYMSVRLRQVGKNRHWIMGDMVDLPAGSPLQLTVEIAGTNSIEKLEIYDIDKRMLVKDTPTRSNKKISITHNLTNLRIGKHAIYIKVVQKDGHMAWSSPIYININN